MLNKEKLAEAMGELDEDIVVEMLEQVMAEGGAEAEAAMEACQTGMNIVGEYFEKGDYFVGDLIYAGELMTQAVAILKDALVKGADGSASSKVILCTVKGDLHDIGKNIVKAMLEAAGFEVVDLGIDVAPEKIVAAAKEQNITTVLLSGVLTLAIDSMKETIELFAQEGMREDLHVLIGGAPVSEEYCKVCGADAWAHNPQNTVQFCKKWAV